MSHPGLHSSEYRQDKHHAEDLPGDLSALAFLGRCKVLPDHEDRRQSRSRPRADDGGSSRLATHAHRNNKQPRLPDIHRRNKWRIRLHRNLRQLPHNLCCSLEDPQSPTEEGLRRQEGPSSRGGDSQVGNQKRERRPVRGQRRTRECSHRNVCPGCWHQQRH